MTGCSDGLQYPLGAVMSLGLVTDFRSCWRLVCISPYQEISCRSSYITGSTSNVSSKIVRQQLGTQPMHLPRARAVSSGAQSMSRVRTSKSSGGRGVLDTSGRQAAAQRSQALEGGGQGALEVRDSTAIIDTFDRVRRHYPKQLPEHTYGILRRSLIAARDRSEARAQRDGVVAEAARRLEKTRKSAKEWTSPSIKSSGMIAIVAASYRRSRNAMKRARVTGQSATLHHWRKEVKTLWYQLRLARPLMTGVAPLIADLKRLETELGDDHNLVVLGATLRACRDLRSMRAEMRRSIDLPRECVSH